MVHIVKHTIIGKRGEGDLNSRGHKTKGLAILRRSRAGPSPQRKQRLIRTYHKKVM